MYSTHSFSLEPLEDRQLLAGVTLLIHGHQGSIKGWVSAAAVAIAERAGEASQYVMKIAKSSGELKVTSFKLVEGPSIQKSSTGEVVVKVDWTSVDDGSYSTERVGKVVGTYLLSKHGSIPALASFPVHLIGHSRGASLAVSITKRLGSAGVWVDQATFLDPHPVEGLFGYGDTSMRTYENVIFADDYWRDDGNDFNFDPDGQRVSGTHQVNLNNIVQKKFVVSAHLAVTSYYHGTIDLNSVFNNDHPVFDSWYGNSDSKPARNRTGFYFSRIVGGARPEDGLVTAFGGTAKRNTISASGPQWFNAGNLELADSSLSQGQRLKLKFIRQDRDSSGSVTVYLDKDQNPYNGFSNMLRKGDLDKAQSTSLTRLSAKTDNVKKGDYFVVIKTADSSGHERFSYSLKMHVA